MAISAPHYHCLKELHRRGELPKGGLIIEIGEANWYGDISPDEIHQNFSKSVMPQLQGKRTWDGYSTVKALYQQLFSPIGVLSIDLHGTEFAHKCDLNIDLPFGDVATTIINHGTLEHIFNPAQVLKTMHDHCEVGGLMLHESPFTGWIDHGFYTIQPTLYYDLAAANGYDMRFMAVTHIEHQSVVEIHSREQLLKMAQAGGVPNNSMLYVAMRKAKDEPFKIPMQGFYAQSISAEASEAWRAMR